MKLFLVERTDDVDYDEYDALVVRALSVTHARLIAGEVEYHNPEDGYTRFKYEGMVKSDLKITELTGDGFAGVVLGSFNAG